MSIRRLPDDVASKIRSSASITSLSGVVLGLLKNSLDAGATRVNIYVDYARGNCTVEDDGRGIAPAEFAEDGGLGKPHFTSKYPPSSGVYGRKGQFLASLAELSLVSIASHHHRFNSHNAISILHGRVLKRHRPALASDRIETFDHGTRVAVRDLFGSMPVRVKHRASRFSERSGVDKEWANLTHNVVALLLAWPSGVSLTVSETKVQVELRLKSGDTTDFVPRIMRLLQQTSVADASDSRSWIPVSASLGHTSIKGCICLEPVATRRSQFISLGTLPIFDEYGSNVLYAEVNKVFKNSSFGVVEGHDTDAQVTNPSEHKIKLRKGVDRWPMFCFRISLSGSEVAVDTDQGPSFRQRDLEDIIHLLGDISHGFLKKHHFRPQKIGFFPKESPLSTEARARQPSRAVPKSPGTIPDDDRWFSRLPSAARNSGSNLLQDLNSMNPNFTSQRASNGGEGGQIQTHEARVTSRSGEGMSARFRDLDLRKSEKKNESGKRPEPSEWLQSVLESWKNPVFETAEPLLRQLNEQTGALANDSDGRLALHRCYGGENIGINFEAGSMNLQGRVSREALASADVISQVDRKFILLRLPWRAISTGATSSALVVLDQHAADERRRLETLMAEYFAEDPRTGGLRAVIETLTKPICFEVSDHEGRLLERYKEHFGAWGVLYSVKACQTQPRLGKPRDDSCRVTVTALPPSILERCRGEPRLLVELTRKEIWRLHDEGIVKFGPCQPRAAQDTPEGLSANFHGCPRGILELLHSRSCRSAIMFNDVLSKEQCEGLVRGLARCALPFQCAHGRPSMVPLVDLGTGGGTRMDEGDTSGALARWKKWMDKM